MLLFSRLSAHAPVPRGDNMAARRYMLCDDALIAYRRRYARERADAQHYAPRLIRACRR